MVKKKATNIIAKDQEIDKAQYLTAQITQLDKRENNSEDQSNFPMQVLPSTALGRAGILPTVAQNRSLVLSNKLWHCGSLSH